MTQIMRKKINREWQLNANMLRCWLLCIHDDNTHFFHIWIMNVRRNVFEYHSGDKYINSLFHIKLFGLGAFFFAIEYIVPLELIRDRPTISVMENNNTWYPRATSHEPWTHGHFNGARIQTCRCTQFSCKIDGNKMENGQTKHWLYAVMFILISDTNYQLNEEGIHS